jgi:hypothetical protein
MHTPLKQHRPRLLHLRDRAAPNVGKRSVLVGVTLRDGCACLFVSDNVGGVR